MTEGTKTILFGCHNIFIHSILIIIAWKNLYKSYPKFWEIICIFLHDLGYIGMNHITNKTNLGHSILGAKIAYKLFGDKGWKLIIGHSRKDAESYNMPLSKLEPPDDYSWLIIPMWLFRILSSIESMPVKPEEWREAVKKNWENDVRLGGTEIFNKLREGDKK